jgi:hypothetical protein
LESEGERHLPGHSAFSLFFLLDQFNQQLVPSNTVFLQEGKKKRETVTPTSLSSLCSQPTAVACLLTYAQY